MYFKTFKLFFAQKGKNSLKKNIQSFRRELFTLFVLYGELFFRVTYFSWSHFKQQREKLSVEESVPFRVSFANRQILRKSGPLTQTRTSFGEESNTRPDTP